MATILNLKTELGKSEAEVAAALGRYGKGTGVDIAFALGVELATQAARVKVLDLTLQGLLPEGKAGRIMTELADAIAASKERATHDETPSLPGDQLPPQG